MEPKLVTLIMCIYLNMTKWLTEGQHNKLNEYKFDLNKLWETM